MVSIFFFYLYTHKLNIEIYFFLLYSLELLAAFRMLFLWIEKKYVSLLIFKSWWKPEMPVSMWYRSLIKGKYVAEERKPKIDKITSTPQMDSTENSRQDQTMTKRPCSIQVYLNFQSSFGSSSKIILKKITNFYKHKIALTQMSPCFTYY